MYGEIVALFLESTELCFVLEKTDKHALRHYHSPNKEWHLGMRQRVRCVGLGGDIALLQAGTDPLEVRL